MRRLRSQRGEVNTQGLAIRNLLTLVALVFLSAATISVIMGLRAAQWSARHARNVISELNGLTEDLVRMESRQRGLLLTRDNNYLDKFYDLAASIDRRTAALAPLLSDNPRQLADFQTLHVLVDQKGLEMKDTIALAQRKQFDEAIKVVRSNFGREKMVAIRELATRMVDEENRLLALRLQKIDKAFYLMVGMVILYIVIAGVVLWKLQRTSLENLYAKDALQTAHDELEMRVRMRTRELTLKSEELTRTNRELDRFAYVASHDLQEPLRKIMMMADLLEKARTERTFMNPDRAVDGIQSAATRMRELIDGILKLSRLASEPVVKESVDLNAVVKDVIANVQADPKATDVEFSVSTLPLVQGNPTQMYQLLQNLIGNAIKFRRDGKSQVRVAVEKQDGAHVMSIQDNGIGIDEKYANRIFEVFERLHGKDAYPGSGIGLAICRKIVEGYGGKIWVKSKVGEGSTFQFTLPPN